jgi:hypothetical protein
MTTVAMVAGMMPVALGFGGDTAFREPMAIAVIGGLLTSTGLTLVIIPAAFSLIDDIERWLGPKFGRVLIAPPPQPAAFTAPSGDLGLLSAIPSDTGPEPKAEAPKLGPPAWWVRLVSHIPMALLNRLADLLGWLAFRVFPYREHVVRENLTKAFPELDEAGICAIMRDYYKGFAQMLVELLKAPLPCRRSRSDGGCGSSTSTDRTDLPRRW